MTRMQQQLTRRQCLLAAQGAALTLLAACNGSRTASSPRTPVGVTPPFSDVTIAPTALTTPVLPTTDTPPAPSAMTTPAVPSTSAVLSPTLPTPALDAWLRANAASFVTTQPDADSSDIQSFGKIVGDARIVALGEGTHGTHEFAEMKHRLVRFLVTGMGFTHFAIEANWPEANRINDYVHGSAGDASALLKGLSSWPVNTQEVLDLIRWMRAYNDQRGGNPAVNFLGFDLQYPHLAMDDVIAYVKQASPMDADRISALYEPFRDYQDSQTAYVRAEAEVQARCRADIGAVYADLDAQKEAYTRASSPQAYAHALRAARIVMQSEEVLAAPTANLGARDRYMAENVAWLEGQAGPAAKLILWAHNDHVGTTSYASRPSMGSFLRQRYGDTLRVFGFDFGAGRFNAVGQDSVNRRYYPLGPHKADTPPADSYEATWERAGDPQLLIDLRQAMEGTAVGDWIRSPHPFRDIGATYDEGKPGLSWVPTPLVDKFDAVIYFAQTTPAKLL